MRAIFGELFGVPGSRWWCAVDSDYEELHVDERQDYEDALWVASSRLWSLLELRRSDGEQRAPR